MTLKLEIRGPLIVLAADFNPSIFKAPWIAMHLLGHAEGDEVPVTEVVVQAPAGVLQLSFLDGIAFNVTPGRTEIFCLTPQAEAFSRLEQVLLKMLSVLPHTPLGAIGCNFTYIDDAPTDEIEDLFKTPEGFEGEGVLTTRQCGVQLQLDDGELLNFSRILTEGGVQYSFNYHRSATYVGEYNEFVPGFIARHLAHSEEILKSLYGYENHTVVGFMPLAGAGEGSSVHEATH